MKKTALFLCTLLPLVQAQALSLVAPDEVAIGDPFTALTNTFTAEGNYISTIGTFSGAYTHDAFVSEESGVYTLSDNAAAGAKTEQFFFIEYTDVSNFVEGDALSFSGSAGLMATGDAHATVMIRLLKNFAPVGGTIEEAVTAETLTPFMLHTMIPAADTFDTVQVGFFIRTEAGSDTGMLDFTDFSLDLTKKTVPVNLNLIGEYQSGIFDDSAAEISAFDPMTDQLFVVNANNGLVDVLDLSDPTTPTFVSSLDPGTTDGGGINSVDVHNGILAIAQENAVKQENGFAVFYDTSNLTAPVNTVTVGALPDMITFTPDGMMVITANEGEPNQPYTVDPVGSVSIIDVSGGAASATVTTVDWSAENDNIDSLRESGVRIFGPGATVAQDLEPEYIAVTPDSTLAYAFMQENNTVGVVDLVNKTAVGLVPLGFKDHMLPGNGIDASDRDNVINIQNWPVHGMYQPDAAKIYSVGGVPYIFTANEGDARDYDGFKEEARVKDLILDETVFPDREALQADEMLGRLEVTNTLGDTDGDGDFDELYVYGARSFAIWDLNGNLVFDSGDQMEQIMADMIPSYFNTTNDETEFDSRSDAKGPEPEAIEVATIGNNTYAFIGLERTGGIMVYDVSDPTHPVFVSYETSRDFLADPTSPMARELAPEDIQFIPAADSPNDMDLIVVASEVSGSITIYEVAPRENFTLTLLHFNDPESQLVHAGSLDTDPLDAPVNGFGGPDSQFVNFGGAARFLTKLNDLRSMSTTDDVIVISGGDNFLPGIELNASDPGLNPANTLGINYDALTIAAANLDVSAIGNHEFDLGPDYLLDWYQQVRTGETTTGAFTYPTSDVAFISANLDVSAIPELDDFISPSVVIEKSGEKIGVVGGTVWYLPTISSPGVVTMVDADGDELSTIDDLAMLIQDEVDVLTESGVNKIILTTHLQNITNEQELVTKLRNVDVVIGAGGNELLANEGDPVIGGRIPFGPYPLLMDGDGAVVQDLDGVNVPVVVSDGDFRYIGKLEMEFDPDGNLVSFMGSPMRVSAFTPDVSFEGETIANDGVAPNDFLFDAVQTPVFDFATLQFQTVIATSQVTLDSRRGEVDPATGLLAGKRLAETNLGNLTADAVLFEGIRQADLLGTSVPQIGFQNGGGIRNQGTKEPGNLTLGDVFAYLPFTNFNSIVEGITPETLKEILEHSVSELPDSAGSFLQIAGFSYVYDVTRTAQANDGTSVTIPGERIRKVWLDDGTMIVENGMVVPGAPTITAATNSFVATGGDGYYWLENLPRADAPSLYGDALINFVQDGLLGFISVFTYGPETVGFRIQNSVDHALDYIDGFGEDTWRFSDYMGWLYIRYSDDFWVWHPADIWMYVSPNNEGPDAVWVFLDGAGWHWTSADIFPNAYSLDLNGPVVIGE
jgi:2',3'-cyclic-nucleotide 2'-phosphodiesterase/3'-nucleotidase/5'-nucleotidase